jgi:hypothetical protein
MNARNAWRKPNASCPSSTPKPTLRYQLALVLAGQQSNIPAAPNIRPPSRLAACSPPALQRTEKAAQHLTRFRTCLSKNVHQRQVLFLREQAMGYPSDLTDAEWALIEQHFQPRDRRDSASSWSISSATCCTCRSTQPIAAIPWRVVP